MLKEIAENYWYSCVEWLHDMNGAILGLPEGSEVTMLMMRPGGRSTWKIGNVRVIMLGNETTFDTDVIGRNIFCLVVNGYHISDDGLTAIRRRIESRFKGWFKKGTISIQPGVFIVM